jgi:hypothetical protein
MCLQPQGASRGGWIDTSLIPPRGFIDAAMHLAVMSAAQRNRKLVADLAAKCRYLRKPEVVGIGGTPAADQAGLLGNRFNVLPVAKATRRRQCQYTFVDS